MSRLGSFNFNVKFGVAHTCLAPLLVDLLFGLLFWHTPEVLLHPQLHYTHPPPQRAPDLVPKHQISLWRPELGVSHMFGALSSVTMVSGVSRVCSAALGGPCEK